MVACPEDWSSTFIGECADILQGGTPRTTNPRFWNGDVIWVTPTEISKNEGLYIGNSDRKITQEGLDMSSAKLLPKGTILLCTRATIGDLAIASRELATNQGFKNLVCLPHVDNAFLSYLLLTLKPQLISRAFGTTFLELSKSDLASIPISIPGISEQRAIAQTLSQLDDHISILNKLIEKKHNIREGAIRELVPGHIRIDDYSVPWIEVSFNEVIKPKARIGWQGLKSHEYLTSGYSYLIGGADFSDGSINLADAWSVSRDRYEMDSNIMVSENDVLVTKDGTIGKIAIVPRLNKPATLNSGVFVFRTNERLESRFLYWVLVSPVFKQFIDSLSAGSTIKHLYQKDLKRFSFRIPDDTDEQLAIADTLTAMDEEIAALISERDKWIQIRDGAMDDLLTGRVRLKN